MISDDALNALMDAHFREPWDERLCRVCGYAKNGDRNTEFICLNPAHAWPDAYPDRADAPLSHLTDAQVRIDRERLPKEKRSEFLVQLLGLVANKRMGGMAVEWAMLNATPHQQCIAMLRALNVEVEG